MLRRKPFSLADDRGIALATVIVLGAVLFALTTIMFIRSGRDLNQARDDRYFERAIHVAESGVDDTLFRIATATNQGLSFSTGDNAPAFASRTEEKSWVIAQSAGKPVVSSSGGEWVAIKPLNLPVVYSVGYVPSRASPRKTRVVRVQYDFAPFVPDLAVLTGGDLDISGNPSIEGTPASRGSAHANDDVTVSGDPDASGFISASDAYTVSGNPDIGDPPNSGGGKPTRAVPSVDARAMYARSQYDLCLDAQVFPGPAYPGPEAPNPGTTPCTGTPLGDTRGGSEYRGWKKSGDDASQGAKWDYSGNVAYDGVYYVYLGSASISGSPGTSEVPWQVTILAEATSAVGPEPNCPHTGGDISYSGNPIMRYHPGAQPVLALAGRDVRFSGNPGTTYQGAFLAHEQFQASGNPSLNGALVAQDTCDTAGSLVTPRSVINGNPEINFTGTLELPGNDVRAALWLEL